MENGKRQWAYLKEALRVFKETEDGQRYIQRLAESTFFWIIGGILVAISMLLHLPVITYTFSNIVYFISLFCICYYLFQLGIKAIKYKAQMEAEK